MYARQVELRGQVFMNEENLWTFDLFLGKPSGLRPNSKTEFRI